MRQGDSGRNNDSATKAGGGTNGNSGNDASVLGQSGAAALRGTAEGKRPGSSPAGGTAGGTQASALGSAARGGDLGGHPSGGALGSLSAEAGARDYGGSAAPRGGAPVGPEAAGASADGAGGERGDCGGGAGAPARERAALALDASVDAAGTSGGLTVNGSAGNGSAGNGREAGRGGNNGASSSHRTAGHVGLPFVGASDAGHPNSHGDAHVIARPQGAPPRWPILHTSLVHCY